METLLPWPPPRGSSEQQVSAKIYRSKTDDGNVRGQPPIKRKDRMMEYVRERGNERRQIRMREKD